MKEKVTIHQLYDAFNRAINYFKDTEFKDRFIAITIVTPIIGKRYIPPIRVEFELIDREVNLLTEVEIVHKFTKVEVFGEQEITKIK